MVKRPDDALEFHADLPGYVMCLKHGKGGKAPWSCPGCEDEGDRPAVAGSDRHGPGSPVASPSSPRPWSAARATVCGRGHKHPSKTEARVCDRLSAECFADGTTLYRGVRLPLLSLAPKDTGTPLYITIDFGIVKGGKLVRLIDAKTRRKSREWARGKLACESAWGIKVEEASK